MSESAGLGVGEGYGLDGEPKLMRGAEQRAWSVRLGASFETLEGTDSTRHTFHLGGRGPWLPAQVFDHRLSAAYRAPMAIRVLSVVATLALSGCGGSPAAPSSSSTTRCLPVGGASVPTPPEGRSSQPTPEAALQEALRNERATPVGPLPAHGWRRAAGPSVRPPSGFLGGVATGSAVSFVHRTDRGTDDLIAYVGREPDGSWFYGGVTRCIYEPA